MLAASHALVGVTFSHRLYSDMHYPQAAEDLAAVIERTRARGLSIPTGSLCGTSLGAARLRSTG
jgi:hypothetical protein